VAALDVYLMSPPRRDWQIRGKANVFSRGQAPVSEGSALDEWKTLSAAIVAAGGEVVVLENDSDPTLTGMPYTAEAGHQGEKVFLLPNVKPPHRKGERALIERALTSWNVPVVDVPVQWEGQGDVIAIGDRFICTSGEGPDARTSSEAYEFVAPHLAAPSMHLRFRADPWFHGNTFLASYRGRKGEIVVVVCPDALLPGELERLQEFVQAGDKPLRRVLTIARDQSLKYATNALQVKNTVIAPRGVPDVVKDLWRELELDVVEVALPILFERGGGGPVCLTNRLSRWPI
jgi:N-dimethylarginine dimethylaminohydrolase